MTERIDPGPAGGTRKKGGGTERAILYARAATRMRRGSTAAPDRRVGAFGGYSERAGCLLRRFSLENGLRERGCELVAPREVAPDGR